MVGWLDRARLGRVLVESEVRARGVVVAEVAAQTLSQVSLVEDDYVVEDLAADGANHALDEGVLPRRARRGENLGDADPFHPSPELVALDAIAIAEEVVGRRVIGERLDDLLRSPSGRGAIGYVEVHDLAAMLQQDHEHVEETEGRSRHDEEVDGDEVKDVVLEERSPGLRGPLPAPRPQTCNRALRNVEPQLEQFAMDARRAPERIGERHGADELRKFGADGRSTRSPASGLPGPESAKALPMPTNDGFGANDVERLAPPCPPPREPHPKGAIEAPKTRSLRAVAEQGELLPERQVLQREIGMSPECSTRGAQESEY